MRPHVRRKIAVASSYLVAAMATLPSSRLFLQAHCVRYAKPQQLPVPGIRPASFRSPAITRPDALSLLIQVFGEVTVPPCLDERDH